MPLNLDERYAEILPLLARDAELSGYLDLEAPIPCVHVGKGPIRLFVVGQDPTVKDAKSRAGITCVLNLKGYGPLHNYLQRISSNLGIDLKQNVYATNYVKNFFVSPPTQIKQADVLELGARYWLPLLREELDEFPDVPVITLGEPLLQHIVKEGASPFVRAYWDYEPHWQLSTSRHWSYLPAYQNHLERTVFPFPHQPSLRKKFYRQHLDYYCTFVRGNLPAA